MFFAPLEIATQALLAMWRRRCGIYRKVFQKLVGSYHSSQKARNSEDSGWGRGIRIDEPDTRKFHRSRFTNPCDKKGGESSFKNGAGPEESEALTKRKHKGQPKIVKERYRKYENGRKGLEIFRHGSEQKGMGRDIWDSGQVYTSRVLTLLIQNYLQAYLLHPYADFVGHHPHLHLCFTAF